MSSPATESDGDPPIQFQLVHAVRGRTRVRVTPPHLAGELARAFERLLQDQPGVLEVRGNVDSGSVVVTYDPEALEIERLFGTQAEAPPSSWTADAFTRARGLVLAPMTSLREAAETVTGQAEALWSAGRDQISAAINFWSANSVVVRSRRLLQRVVSGSGGAKKSGSRR